MIGAAYRPLLADDPTFMAKWHAAIAGSLEEDRPVRIQIMELCCAIERQIRDCSLLLRDCNVIAARVIDCMERFNSTEGPLQ